MEIKSSEDLHGKNNTKDINASEFMEDVIEASSQKPVIVDFWAPWCGPCKQITPALEKAVNSETGRVVLAKVNIDENQSIAAQLGGPISVAQRPLMLGGLWYEKPRWRVFRESCACLAAAPTHAAGFARSAR